nr:AAA family ATPase [Pyxidicoccus caerfyrddinensis]
MSPRPPDDDEEEQSLSVRARTFHAQATDIQDLSDGVKAYTGILSALLSGKSRIIIIDEPEAFLHPALARRLAFEISVVAKERNANVIAATHSADFLMGCIEAGAGTQIVRLTYSNSLATARHMPADDLSTLMRIPLLRTTNVLGALFHVGAVVTESEADRAFYDEVNHRLIGAKDEGARGVSFLFAQNKQTVHTILRPLRRLGIPAAAIVDMDVVKEGGKVFSNILEAAGVPSLMRQSLGDVRGKLKDALDAANPNWKIQGGIGTLGKDDAAACRDFIEKLAEYGVFVVPGGELESWLPHLKVNKSKHLWLGEVFGQMGSDPASADYMKPSLGDVWEFMRRIARWIGNPNRKGLPL